MKKRVWPLPFWPYGIAAGGVFFASAAILFFLLMFMIGPCPKGPPVPGMGLFLAPGAGLLWMVRQAGLPLSEGAILLAAPLAYAIFPLALWYLIGLAMMLRGWRHD